MTPNLANAPLTPAQWREDLAFMVTEMEQRHPDLYNQVSSEAFGAAVADLHRDIPTMQRHEIVVGLMRIAALVADGHTNVSPLKDTHFGFRAVPLQLYVFEEGLYVRAAAPELVGLVGARVETIGGVPFGEALSRVAQVSPRDNEHTLRFYAPVFLAMPEILHALGLSPSPDRAVLGLTRDASHWTANVPAGSVSPIWPPDTDISLATPAGWVDARRTSVPPLWLQAPLDRHRLVDLPEQDALYAQLNRVTNVPGQSLEQFGVRIRARAEATSARAILLDLRLNRGGDGSLRYGFVRELIKAEEGDTQLFVLVGRGSFSATQFILDDLDRYTQAVLVGEPAGSKPTCFGDSLRVTLPNSGLTARVSILRWQVDQLLRPWTPLDVAAPLTFADYVDAKDAALDAALAYRPQPGLASQLRTAAASGGLAAVRTTLDAYVADPANRYRALDDELIAAADALIEERRHEEAVTVAGEAAARFPENALSHLLLGLAAEAVDRRAQAFAAARRALELDPNGRTTLSLLERLGQPGR